MRVRIGIDLGGTKIEALALDEHGAELTRVRVPTPLGEASAIVEAIVKLVDAVEGRVGAHGSVGIATPGSLSPLTGRMRNSNTTCLNGVLLDRVIEDAIGRRVRIENDANCLALSEAVDGAASHGRVVFGVILGTGTGGGVVVDRQLRAGRNAVAGEWGHNPLPWLEPVDEPVLDCYCGKRGCIETYLSGAGLARDHRRAGGADIGAKDIARLAERGDALACATVRRYARRLAKGLATVIHVLDPDVVVLGGGLSNISSLYDEIGRQLGELVLSDLVRTDIVGAKHGDSSGVRGAAWLWSAEEAAALVPPVRA